MTECNNLSPTPSNLQRKPNMRQIQILFWFLRLSQDFLNSAKLVCLEFEIWSISTAGRQISWCLAKFLNFEAWPLVLFGHSLWRPSLRPTTSGWWEFCPWWWEHSTSLSLLKKVRWTWTGGFGGVRSAFSETCVLICCVWDTWVLICCVWDTWVLICCGSETWVLICCGSETWVLICCVCETWILICYVCKTWVLICCVCERLGY